VVATPNKQNLYMWSASGLSLLSVLPGDTQEPRAPRSRRRAAAVSSDGRAPTGIWAAISTCAKAASPSRWTRHRGEGAFFQAASSDGRFAFFTKGTHLFRYDATSEASVDLTRVAGWKECSELPGTASRVYFLDASGLFLWNGGATTEVRQAAAASDYPPAHRHCAGKCRRLPPPLSLQCRTDWL